MLFLSRTLRYMVFANEFCMDWRRTQVFSTYYVVAWNGAVMYCDPLNRDNLRKLKAWTLCSTQIRWSLYDFDALAYHFESSIPLWLEPWTHAWTCFRLFIAYVFDSSLHRILDMHIFTWSYISWWRWDCGGMISQASPLWATTKNVFHKLLQHQRAFTSNLLKFY